MGTPARAGICRPALTPERILAMEKMAEHFTRVFVMDERRTNLPLIEATWIHLPDADRKLIRKALRWIGEMADYLRQLNPGITDPQRMLLNWDLIAQRRSQQSPAMKAEAVADVIISSLSSSVGNGHRASTPSSTPPQKKRSTLESRTLAGSTTRSRGTLENGARSMTRKAGAAAG